MMATTTTPVAVVVAQQTKEEIARLFPVAVYGGRVARALDALAALDARVRADLLCGPLVPEAAPFARPHAGSLYEADTLTWRFYHTNAGSVEHAINNAAYGAAIARTLYGNLLFQLEEDEANEEAAETYLILKRPLGPSLDRVRAALLSLRRTLRALSSYSPSVDHHGYHD